MPHNSLKKLLDKFPYFLDKSDDSNFTKTQKVFNNRLADLYNELFQVYLSSKLEKNLLVWKEQEEAYVYTINFVAIFPYLKKVTCFKNDEVIYSEAYNYDDEINTFIYSYDSYSENIIPTDKFKITVETFEEYVMEKGFPENEEIEGNEYDHDASLDNFGLLYNIPRKTYKTIEYDESSMNELEISDTISYLNKTEPKFNNQSNEDDYHYMNRILTYINCLQDIPLQILEIWKIYGLPIDRITLINREKYLCKMFEESRHSDNDGEYNINWSPQQWEHKDLMCGKSSEDIFFFANVNNPSPIQGQSIRFSFNFFNEFARKVSNNYLIIPYVNGQQYNKTINTSNEGFSWTIPTKNIPGIDDDYIFDFTFRAYEKLSDLNDLNSNYLESDIIRVTIKGCESADLFVDCIMGSNANDGTTRDTAFKSLDYALSQINGSNNVIALINNNERFYIDDVLKINESCSIISCPRGAVVYQKNGFEIFKVMQDKHLYLQNILLKHKCCEMYANSSNFINENKLNYPIDITIPKWVCKINTQISMKDSYNVYVNYNYVISGVLTTIDGYENLKNEIIELYDSNEELIDTTTTNDNGVFKFNQLFTTIGNYQFKIRHPESSNYCGCETVYSVTVFELPVDSSYIIVCNKNNPTEITIVDSFPFDNSAYGEEDIFVLTELNNSYPKIIITTDVDFDMSGLSEDDIVIVDGEDNEYNIILIDDGDG